MDVLHLNNFHQYFSWSINKFHPPYTKEEADFAVILPWTWYLASHAMPFQWFPLGTHEHPMKMLLNGAILMLSHAIHNILHTLQNQ